MAYLHEVKGSADDEPAEEAGREDAAFASVVLDPLLESGLYADATWILRGPGRRIESHATTTPRHAIYDLASITKPFTASVALWAASRGLIDLDEPVFPERLLCATSLDALLRHQGGARAWWPLYSGTGKAEAQLLSKDLWPGTPGVYSDVGYLVAARWIERRTGRSLLELLKAFLAAELPTVRIHDSGVPVLFSRTEQEGLDPRPLSSPCSTGKEVELAAAQGLEIVDLGAPDPGQPQDGNSRWMARRGALAGHAGLFGTAQAVEQLLARWLRALAGPEDTSGGSSAPSALDRALQAALVPKEGRFLGWQRPAEEWKLSEDVFGHYGFTGGAVWVDPGRRSYMVLLAHRVRHDSNLEPSRRAVTEAWQRWAISADVSAGPPAVDW